MSSHYSSALHIIFRRFSSANKLSGSVRHAATMSATASTTIPKTMRAWQMYQFGNIDQLTLSDTCRTPCIDAPDKLLVEVHAATVNPMDVMMLSGYGATALNIPRQCFRSSEFPLTLGRDFSGIVRGVGRSARKKGFMEGQAVFGAVWPWKPGCHAEFVSVSSCHVARKPEQLSHAKAACLGYAGQTAFVALRDMGGLGRNSEGKRVLVVGASGGVGTIAVQLATAWGAHVTCTCPVSAVDWMEDVAAIQVISSDREADLGRDGGYHVILDLVGREEQLTSLLHPGQCSRYVSLRSPFISYMDQYGTLPGAGLAAAQLIAKTTRQLFSGANVYNWSFFRPSSDNLEEMAWLADRALLSPVVGLEVDFSRLHDAFSWVSGKGKKGKAVVRVVGH